MLYDWIIAPFVDQAFMRRALVGAIALSVSASPIGVFLMLRRMSLSGDVLAHAMLPGVAIGFLLAGLDVVAMTAGGFVAGIVVAIGAGAVSRLTSQHEDASLAAFYLISLAAGVVLLSSKGSDEELLHVLFGSILELSGGVLLLLGAIASLTLLTLAVLWRPLVAECLDPSFLRTMGGGGATTHAVFLLLVVANIVGGMQAQGTLLSVGLMMLPAAAARFWTRSLEGMCLLAISIGIAASIAGLLIAHHGGLPPGPSVILSAGVVYLVALVSAPYGVLLRRLPGHYHKTA